MSDKDKLIAGPLTKEEKSSYFVAKIVLGALNLLSAIILSIAVGVSSNNWQLHLTATTDYRFGGQNDDYPSGPSLQAVGNTKIEWVAVFIGYLFAAGTLVQILFHDREMAQISTGGNPYLWISLMFWFTPLFLVAAFVAGITNVWLLVFVILAVWSMLGFFWDHDLINHPKYVAAIGKMTATYSWVVWARGLAAAIVVEAVHIGYLINTFGSTATAPRTLFVVPAVLVMVLVLAYPIVVFLKYMGWFDKRLDTYSRDYFFVVYGGIFALAASWISVLIFRSAP